MLAYRSIATRIMVHSFHATDEDKGKAYMCRVLHRILLASLPTWTRARAILLEGLFRKIKTSWIILALRHVRYAFLQEIWRARRIRKSVLFKGLLWRLASFSANLISKNWTYSCPSDCGRVYFGQGVIARGSGASCR